MKKKTKTKKIAFCFDNETNNNFVYKPDYSEEHNETLQDYWILNPYKEIDEKEGN
jgi:hypothetical protein